MAARRWGLGDVALGFGVGLVGAVSATNSLIGSAVNTRTGFYNMPLTNGNYVVGSPGWGPPGGGFRGGAVTWVDGSVGAVGEVEACFPKRHPRHRGPAFRARAVKS